MGTLFGTDGIRGIANEYPMTAELAMAIGRATASILKRNHTGLNRILVGKDTRLSGYMFENALTAGICSMGVDVLLTGPLPTPGIAYLTRSMRCVAGIVISASHNPFQDNGIKIFASTGYKLSDILEDEIEQLVASGELLTVRPPSEEIGRARRIDDAAGRYIEFCKATFPAEYNLQGMKIAIDCANGAAHRIAPTIFTELGAEVYVIHSEPDGMNINDSCGSQFTSDLRKKVVEIGADIGLAFDGDADRLIAVDNQGMEISGDHILGICAKHLHEAGLLEKNLVILTPMSNLGLRMALENMGIRYMDAGVGDRLVLELMIREGARLGGEQSGHIIFHDKHTTGDGIVTALQLLAVMKSTDKPLSELVKIFTPAPQVLVNIHVSKKPPLETIGGVAASLNRCEKVLGNKGRILVRYSGTQMLCRVMVEATSQEIAESICNEISAEVDKAIGLKKKDTNKGSNE